MKKTSIFVAVILAIGISVSSCSSSGRVGTKHHEVGVSGHVK